MPQPDPPLTPRPKIRLSRLRDIGWALWDPIGLLPTGKRWDEEDCLPFADEYDAYLLQAAAELRRGAPANEVAHYLASIQIDHMALGTYEQALDRALSVVTAIKADKAPWTTPED